MPTQHPRISVVRDETLTAALAATRSELAASSEAGRLRELALLGAQALGQETARDAMRVRHLREKHGLTGGDGDIVEASRRALAEPDGAAESSQETLDWVRGSR